MVSSKMLAILGMRGMRKKKEEENGGWFAADRVKQRKEK